MREHEPSRRARRSAQRPPAREPEPEPRVALVAALRQLPPLDPADSVFRAAECLRGYGADLLAVVDARGRFAGVVAQGDLAPMLARGALSDAPLQPVGAWARRPERLGRAAMSLDEVRAALAESGEPALVILDDRDRYLGTVSVADLLAPSPVPPRPASVGGMATPWGVYLSGGGVRGGVGQTALLASGVVLGLLLGGAHAAAGLVAIGVQRATGWPLFTVWNSARPSGEGLGPGLAWMLAQAMALPVFLLALRLCPLTGYHAAEHQAVHAMERGEPLEPGVVRRMPRIHPRCGTNLIAGVLVFAAVMQSVMLLHGVGLDAADGALLGAVAAAFTWRRLGALLQQYFTTRPATDRQIESGVAAAREVQSRYLSAVPTRAALPGRLWLMGLPQTMLGVSLGTSAALYAADWLLRIALG